MALPWWMYQDPSKHVDYIREKRKEYEDNSREAKQKRAKEELERLFGDKGRDEQE